MPRSIEVALYPSEYLEKDILEEKIGRAAGFKQCPAYRILRRSLDSRKKPIYRLRVEILEHGEEWRFERPVHADYQQVQDAEPVHIIGAGPAGYFAALECLKVGLKPVIFEQGKNVRARRIDLRAIQQDGIVNAQSNYCFGEGGAGTYSDGKLYTRLKKRRQIENMLRTLVEHGANPDILIDAHPHIGSNKLPKVIANIRKTIIEHGGNIYFESKLTDLKLRAAAPHRIEINHSTQVEAHHIVLATGHSARDIYALLVQHQINLEFKPFAIGVRIEHPQHLIDQIQYGESPRAVGLPPAAYRFTSQYQKKGVFSFCMCPGGLVVPAATAPGEVVVNGMSLSRRDSAFANSGYVVQVDDRDLEVLGFTGPMAGVDLQRMLEQHMFELANRSQQAPAQRIDDFLLGQGSSDLPRSSYIPGHTVARLDQELPMFLVNAIRAGLLDLKKRMPNFIHKDAIAIGIESRTSAPVRIPRDPVTMAHHTVPGLYPCGEGAGYAGGIVSAALDGERVVRAIQMHAMQ